LIILQSIRVRNFRAIKEAVFKPQEEGITGIFGPNGAGKTTFLAATLFALYGVKPSGAGQSSLRRIGSKGESSVSVVFTHLGQQVEIIRELKSPNNRVVVNIYVDGVPQTVTSVTAADQWIKTRLGIDANGFMTAFVVRQKELDQLVQAKPAERKQLIEKLAGIDAINIALKSSREDENSLKKSLTNMSGSENEMVQAATVMEASAARLETLKKEIDAISKDIKPLEDKISKVKNSASEINDKTLQIASLTSRKETLEQELETIKEELSSIPEIYEDENTIEELRQKYSNLKQKLQSETETLNSIKVQFLKTKEEYDTNNVNRKKIEEEINIISASFKKVNYPELLQSQSESLQQLENQIFNLTVKNEETAESIESLNHSKNCPTCLQELKHPEKIIENLKQIIAQNEENIVSFKATLEENTTLYNKTVVEYGFQQKHDTLVEELKKYTLTVTEDDVKKLQATISEKEKLIVGLETEMKNVEQRGVKLKESQTYLIQQKALEDKQAKTVKTISNLEVEINQLVEQIGGLEVLKDSQNLTKFEQELAYLKNQLSEKQQHYAAAKQKHSTDKTTYETIRDSWDKKRKLIEKQQALTLTSEMLNKFRLDTISSLAPELSETATNLISEMTNGDFTEIRLDEEFNAYLTDAHGIERPSTWLSGGEESAVALALRIAIAFLITGGNPSLLWLDEVLTAQDADRRSTMLTMIRQLPIQQIIMINHTQEAADIVDKTVEIIPNIVEGSTIKETTNIYADNNIE
jgi:DNA repair protein SbcC/Rad50